ncbi:MAG: hypothetical protein MK066_05335 [Crocinitomicaceae bacterium]|nr:hypothetical protein [Crocinitomicaceae bacterium]
MSEEELGLLRGLIKLNYSGSQSELSSYLNLAMQTGAVLIAGIVLWRISAKMHSKKKAQRSRNSYFETPYAKGWKRK